MSVLLLPGFLFQAGLWLSIAGVAAGAGTLFVMFVREWRRGELW